MIVLDSDHLTILTFPGSEQYARLSNRMAASADQRFATTTIVNAEEQLRGWLAEINRYLRNCAKISCPKATLMSRFG